MSARKLTHLLSSDELDALRAEMLDRASKLTGPACQAWMDAVILMGEHRSASFQRRAGKTPSLRRKSLGLRITR